MSQLIEINKYPVKSVLKKLLCDKTTGKNIIYATDQYSIYGCEAGDQITVNNLSGFSPLVIQPRVSKSLLQQSERTRSKAEVFTPTWVVRQMNSQLELPSDLKQLASVRVLEITCGEAPFLTTRYDATTGELIELNKRAGLLDLKLQAISQHTSSEQEWLKLAYKAYESTYGYEFQGDNLLIARINLLVTFCDYLSDKFNRRATDSELTKLANIIVWNIFQMDGLKDTVPFGVIGQKYYQFSLFEPGDCAPSADDVKVYDFRARKSLLFRDIKEEDNTMKFEIPTQLLIQFSDSLCA